MSVGPNFFSSFIKFIGEQVDGLIPDEAVGEIFSLAAGFNERKEIKLSPEFLPGGAHYESRDAPLEIEGGYTLDDINEKVVLEAINAQIPPDDRQYFSTQQLGYIAGLSEVMLASQFQEGKYQDFVIVEEDSGKKRLDTNRFFKEVLLPEMIKTSSDCDADLFTVVALMQNNRMNTPSLLTYNNDVVMSNRQWEMSVAGHAVSFLKPYLPLLKEHIPPGLYSLLEYPMTNEILLAAADTSIVETDVDIGEAIKSFISNPFSKEAKSKLIEAKHIIQDYLENPASEENRAKLNIALQGSNNDGSLGIWESNRLLRPTVGINDVEPEIYVQAISAYGMDKFPPDIQEATRDFVYRRQVLQEGKQNAVLAIESFVNAHGSCLDAFFTTSQQSNNAWDEIGLGGVTEEGEVPIEGASQLYDGYSRLGNTAVNQEYIFDDSYNDSKEWLARSYASVYNEDQNRARMAFLEDQFRNQKLYEYLKLNYPELSGEIDLLQDSAEALDPIIQDYWAADTRMMNVILKDGRDTDPHFQMQITAGLAKHLFEIAESKFSPPLPYSQETRLFLTQVALMAREISPWHQLGGDAEELPNIINVDSVYNQEAAVESIHLLWSKLLEIGVIPQDKKFDFEYFYSVISTIDISPSNILTEEQAQIIYPYFKNMSGEKGSDTYGFTMSSMQWFHRGDYLLNRIDGNPSKISDLFDQSNPALKTTDDLNYKDYFKSYSESIIGPSPITLSKWPDNNRNGIGLTLSIGPVQGPQELQYPFESYVNESGEEQLAINYGQDKKVTIASSEHVSQVNIRFAYYIPGVFEDGVMIEFPVELPPESSASQRQNIIKDAGVKLNRMLSFINQHTKDEDERNLLLSIFYEGNLNITPEITMYYDLKFSENNGVLSLKIKDRDTLKEFDFDDIESVCNIYSPLFGDGNVEPTRQRAHSIKDFTSDQLNEIVELNIRSTSGFIPQEVLSSMDADSRENLTLPVIQNKPVQQTLLYNK